MYTRNMEPASSNSVCPSSDRLFLGDLNYEVEELSIREYCKSWGELAECRVMRDQKSGKSRGFAFVRFKTFASARHFLNNTHYIGDSRVSLKAISREQNTLDVQPLLKVSKRIFASYFGSETAIERLQFHEHFSKFGVISELTTHSSSALNRSSPNHNSSGGSRCYYSGFAVIQFVLAESVERCFAESGGGADAKLLLSHTNIAANGVSMDVRRIVSEEDLMKRKRKLLEEEVLADAQIAALERKNADGSTATKRPR